MTSEPQRLTSRTSDLSAEKASAEVLRRRLAGVVARGRKRKAGGGEDEEEGGMELETGLVRRAGEMVEGYVAWLAEPGGEFGGGGDDGDGGGGKEREGEVTGDEQEVLDIIDEVLFRQRYIANQLALFNLQSPPTTKPSHISKLQSYNEIKDAAQELMGLVAENRGVVVGTLYESGEFGVSSRD